MAAATRTLQETVDWARTFTALMPIVGVGGFTEEPALTICNKVIQEMLAPPFPWKFNRVELTTFPTIENIQDYQETVADVSWLESCELEDFANTGVIKPIREIEVVQDLPRESNKDNPIKVCKLLEDATTTTFRFWRVPTSTVWTAFITYQRRAPLKTSLQDLWTPLTDDLAWVYEQGFYAWALTHASDRRAGSERQTFLANIARMANLKDAETQHEGLFPSRELLWG